MMARGCAGSMTAVIIAFTLGIGWSLTGAGVSATEVRASATAIPGRRPAASVLVRPGRWQVAADIRPESRRFHGSGTAPGWIDSWAAGHLAVRWARGVTGLSASPGPGAALSGGTTLVGGGVRFRRGRRALLLAGGRRPSREPAVFLAWTQPGAGVLVTGRPAAGGRRLADPLASLSLGFHRPGRGGEVEVVAPSHRRPMAAMRMAADLRGLSTQLELRLPGIRELATARPLGPMLEIEMRSSSRGARAVMGARAILPGGERPPPQNTATSRSFLEITFPLGGEPQAETVVRGELRRDSGIDLSRLHAEVRTPLSRAGADWTSGGGLLMRLRFIWRLPAALTVETGAAAWSGPVAKAGVAANLPAVPDGALAAPLARPGEAAGAVIDWQPGRVRVRLGVSMRQPRHGPVEARVASRLDFVLREDDVATPSGDRGAAGR